MKADLHIHSFYSDGMYSPTELARLAQKNGVRLASVTDHDNFMGDEEKRRVFSDMGITYVSGIEISAYENEKKIHLTGYAFDCASPLLREYQKELFENSIERLYDVLEKLKRYKGIELTAEEVYAQQALQGIPVHTMHVVKALKEKRLYKTYRDVFRDCFLPGLPTYSFVGRWTPEQAIDRIHSLGGICCIAHPGRLDMGFEEREKIIYRLKEMGVDGMECFYSTHTEEQTAYFEGLCEKLGLFRSGGSDFHSDFGSREIGKPYFQPSDEFLRALKVRLP